MSAKEQLQEAQEKLARLDPNNRDHLADIASLKSQISDLVKQAEQEEKDQAVLEKNHEKRVQTAKDEFGAYIQSSLHEDGITEGDIFVSETAHRMYTIKCSQAFNALVSKISAQLAGAEERELQLKRQNDDLQDKLEAMQAELRTTQAKASQLEFERDEAIKNRDNAANALEEAKDEIDRLNSQVDDLRKEIAVGARNAYKVVDAEDQQKQIDELKKKLVESRIRIVNMRPVEEDFKRQTWQAEDALTGETLTFNYLEKGRYIELNNDEVLQFRLEHAQKAPVPAAPLVPPALPPVTGEQFPGSTGNLDQSATGTENGAGEETEPGSSTNDSAVSRAEFQALEARVAALEQTRANVA